MAHRSSSGRGDGGGGALGSLPPGARSSLLGVALLMTAAGGGSGIGALLSAWGGGKDEGPELRSEFVLFRAETREKLAELVERVGKLQRLSEDRISNDKAAADQARSHLRGDRPDVAGALKALEQIR